MRVQQDKGYINMDEKIVFCMSLIFEVPPAMCQPTHSVTIWALSQEYLIHNIRNVAGVTGKIQISLGISSCSLVKYFIVCILGVQWLSGRVLDL